MAAQNKIKKRTRKDSDTAELLSRLNASTREHVLKQPAFKKMLDKLSKEISSLAITAPNEATISSHMELKLYGLLKDVFNCEFLPDKETQVNTVRHVKKGRLDSRVGALVVEYKHHTKLVTPSDQKKALGQLENYLKSMTSGAGQTLTGILTDGKLAQVIEAENSEILSCIPLKPLCSEHLEYFVRHALMLEQTALSPENLVKDFCSFSNPIAINLAKSLLETFKASATARSNMLFKEWQVLFRLAHDDVSKQQAIIDRKKALAATLNITILPGDNESEYEALFALQTAFAIIVKLIALKVISSIRQGHGEVSFLSMAKSDDSALQSKLFRLEEGDIFREMGFANLLEGDFFAWYCTPGQWSPVVAKSVREIFGTLSKYEDQPLFKGSEGIKDFLKDLYMNIIPDKVRHSLGEFYTPPWLADHVLKSCIKRLKNKTDFRFLDPCCGSGTFITAAIRNVLSNSGKKADNQTKLTMVLKSVKGIDLNPLAVLTARINYFLNLSHLVADNDRFEIPVYLGDSSNVPTRSEKKGVICVSYKLGTLKGPLEISLPESAISDVTAFSESMTDIEQHIKNHDEKAIVDTLWKLSSKKEAKKRVSIKANLALLAKDLVDLEKQSWNGIWARIITNFLTTACLGEFNIIAGNPPWVDWKNLPTGYRTTISELCIDRALFSGDGVTGGINLNICALIANVSADNWLSADGILAFLMPDTLLFQKSYEGFRRLGLSGGRQLYFQHIDDWTRAGHPFAPVQQRFFTYIISEKKQDYNNGITVDQYVKLQNSKTTKIKPLKEYHNCIDYKKISHVFDIKKQRAFTASKSCNAFSLAADYNEQTMFSHVAGKCNYSGREGIEFYPQELFLLNVLGGLTDGKVRVRNYQNTKSKHKIARQDRLLETCFLHPLVKGTQISRFSLEQSEFVVPFPYEVGSRSPLGRKQLTKASKLLMSYLQEHEIVLRSQTSYNEKIIGEKHVNEFYALARVGMYSYGEHFVAFRDNTKWGAVVVSSLETPWGEKKRPVFQNHAVTISQRPDGTFISRDEAHYICAILNAPLVAQYILKSSDSRSYKIRPPIKVPTYDSHNPLHRRLCSLSKKAHKYSKNQNVMKKLDAELDAVYLEMLHTLCA